VFLINSCLDLFTAASQRLAFFLPKLQNQFAEFLNRMSPTLLRKMYVTTCVSLWYVYALSHHFSIFLGAFARHRVSKRAQL